MRASRLRAKAALLPNRLARMIVANLLLLVATPSVNAQLVINEVDYDNAGTGGSPEPYADIAEWIELKNIGSTAVDLAGVQVELVQGNGGAATVYRTIVLPSFMLAAGDYFVIGNNAATPNIDLVVTPAQNLIQNGSPDAIGLRSQAGGPLLDALSYEGSSGVPYSETTGAGTLGDDMDNYVLTAITVARYPDGSDTNDNSTDWRVWCATPGQSNDLMDADGDQIPACADNCPLVFNPDQRDADLNNIGDVCETYPCVIVPQLTEQEPNGTPATASAYCGNSFIASAAIAPVGDQDYFDLGDVEAGSLIFATIDCGGGSQHFELTAFDDFGGTLGYSVEESSLNCPFGAKLQGTVAPGGHVFVRVNEVGNNATIASYQLSAVVLPPVGMATPEVPSCNDLPSQPQSGSDYFVGSDVISSDVVDYYSFTGFAGERVLLVTTANSLEVTQVIGPFGSLYGAVGTVSQGMRAFDLVQTGTYLVRVNGSGGYLLYIDRPYEQEAMNGVDDNCDGVVDEYCPILLRTRVMLEGPYDSGTGLMSDTLMTTGLLPLNEEPYTALGYTHVGGGGEAPTTGQIGVQPLVDWVVLELRSAADPAIVVATRCALLKSDGHVVDMDGIAPVHFDLAPGDYHVAVRHRNHLGAMTSAAFPLSSAITTVDLTSPTTGTYGTDARKSIQGAFPTMALWAGDVGFDKEIKYVGNGNDRDPILIEIGGSVPTNEVTGYSNSDVNMDGTIRYVGAKNDRDPILVNIGGSVPTNVRVGQLP